MSGKMGRGLGAISGFLLGSMINLTAIGMFLGFNWEKIVRNISLFFFGAGIGLLSFLVFVRK